MRLAFALVLTAALALHAPVDAKKPKRPVIKTSDLLAANNLTPFLPPAPEFYHRDLGYAFENLPDILREFIEPAAAPLVASHVFHQRDIAKFATGGLCGLL